MAQFLLNETEVRRVMKENHLSTVSGLEARTGMTRKTWAKALRDLHPTPQVLDALAELGARPNHILKAAP